MPDKRFRSRSRAREYAFQMMYRYCMTGEDAQSIPSTFWEPLGEVKSEQREFADTLFQGASEKVEEHNVMIEEFLREGWNYDRLGEIEKNALRLGIYELFLGESPYYAVVNDYVSISKKYGDDGIASLVNGMLENIRKTYKLTDGEDAAQKEG
ncbi:transcription antitermination factor NusB [Limisalsivibrio acetivorans]|uniref:transcription antitermination factor NusB n=1 Tax=Limisalsivibrio acetivorans TaxID=1304888 RepID=UPI0003B4D59F|nr:transcription antitermination factor NusB [Limisalsivibrio acetivorans]